MTSDDRSFSTWPAPPATGSFAEFVFLAVDVIEHSRLFRDEMSVRERKAVYKALEEFRRFVAGMLPTDMLWDWAGDGGIFAIPNPEVGPSAADRALGVAIRIWRRLPALAAQYPFPDGAPLRARIVLGAGTAYYHEDQGLRRGKALNIAGKLKVPGGRTSISATEKFVKELDSAVAKDFLRLNYEIQGTRVYGYTPAMRQALREEISACQDDPMNAAHLAYRLGTLHVDAGERDAAVGAFDECLRLMNEVQARHRYFFWTMHTFYRLWATFAAEGPIDETLRKDHGRDRLQMLRGDRVQQFFDDHHLGKSWRLLVHMEFCMEQMDILAQRPVTDPIGLASLQICLLLERVGYSRRFPTAGIEERLTGIEEEMREFGDESIDGHCSLCSATAASCLSLAYRTNKATALVKWLRTLKQYRYAYLQHEGYTDAEPHEHAIHYTAAVLRTFLDIGSDADVDSAVDVFFDRIHEEEYLSSHYPKSWTRYRNEGFFEFSPYIFHAFTQLFLSGRKLSDARAALLRHFLSILTARIMDEACEADLPEKPARSYAARENLGSMALGLFVGTSPRGQAIAKAALDLYDRRASRPTEPLISRRRTLDSSLDRTRIILEGWLLHWESALYLSEKGDQELPAYVWECFGITSRTS